MRATELLRLRDPRDRASIARLLQAESETDDGLIAAMRSPLLAHRVLRRCDSDLMREDVLLLSANPFDPVRADELVEPAGFVRLGLIQEVSPREFVVNLDMALAILPETNLEFGFALTLLARLDAESALQLARTLGIGPKPARTDLLIEAAARLTDRDAVLARIARLSDAEREPLREALELGELPDALTDLDPDAEHPAVTLDESTAGRLGLLFRIGQPARNAAERPVVPLELLADLPEWLEKVPAAPEAKATRARAPRGTRSATRRGTGTDLPRVTSPPETPAPFRAVDHSRPRSGPPSTLELMKLPGLQLEAGPAQESRSTAPAPTKVVRTVSGLPVAAWVDLERPGAVETVRRDPQLGPAIAEVIEDRYVLLAGDVDPEQWVQRCALRLQWDAS